MSLTFFFLLVLFFGICTILCSIFDKKKRIYMKLALVSGSFFISGIIICILFVAFAHPVDVSSQFYPLNSFTKLENGYSYTYDGDNQLCGGFASIGDDSLAYYEEVPYLEITTYGERIKFLFLYNDSPSRSHTVNILHVLSEADSVSTN